MLSLTPQQEKHITALVMWMTALSQSVFALYLPAFPAISDALKLSSVEVKYSLTICFIGFGVSQLCYGPLSDRYGRKKILLIGLTIFCIGCLINIVSHTLSMFLIARL